MKLSILICSIFERRRELSGLMDILFPQVSPLKDVQVLIDVDDKAKSIGAKRNDLLQKADGEYIVFIDDDDGIADDYVSKLYHALETGPDCVGIEGVMTIRGHNPKRFVHSLRFQRWTDNGTFYERTPNHWNPVRRELAIKAGFPEINWGEDHAYSNNLYPLLKTEVFVDGPVYFYLNNPEASAANKRRQECSR